MPALPRWIAGLLAVLALTAAGCEQRPLVALEERYEVESLARARIHVEDGAVTVAEGRPGAVVVTGDYPDGVHEYSGSVAAGEARIELLRTRSLAPRFGQRGARVEVLLPPGTAVEVESSNGSVEVTGAFAVSRARTSNGRLTVTGAEGDLVAETSNGRIHVERHTGALTARSSNGAVEVSEQRGGLVLVTTSNGAIRYQGTIEGGPRGDGENTFETSNGAVEVVVAGTPSFELDASTSNGGVTSRFALLDQSRSDSRLSGRVGEGGPRLVIRTSNGPIEVR